MAAAELNRGEGDVDEAARQERLRSAQESASSSQGDEGQSRFPEPEERGYYVSDLFGKAAYVDAAEIMEHGEACMHALSM